MVATQGIAPQGQAPDFSGEDPFAFINGRKGGKSISFQTKYNGQPVSVPIGTSFTGVVAENPQVVPQYKFQTDQNAPPVLDTWPDGNPKKQVRVALSNVQVFRPDLAQAWQDVRVLNEGDAEGDAEDDGRRTLYIKDQMKQALADAQKAAGVQGWGIGTRIIVRLIDLKDTGKGYPQKIYAVELSEIQPYVPDAVAQHNAEMNAALGGGQQQWAPSAPAAPSQGAPQFVTPEQPAFPGQVVPQAAPAPQQLPNTGAQLPPAAPAPQAAPAVPQQSAPAIDPSIPAPPLNAPVPADAPPAPQTAPAAPAAPQGGVDMAQAVAQLRAVIAQNVPREAALAGVAQMLQIPVATLDQADQNTPF